MPMSGPNSPIRCEGRLIFTGAAGLQFLTISAQRFSGVAAAIVSGAVVFTFDSPMPDSSYCIVLSGAGGMGSGDLTSKTNSGFTVPANKATASGEIHLIVTR